jgi:hypothetical protein
MPCSAARRSKRARASAVSHARAASAAALVFTFVILLLPSSFQILCAYDLPTMPNDCE